MAKLRGSEKATVKSIVDTLMLAANSASDFKELKGNIISICAHLEKQYQLLPQPPTK